MTFVLHPGPIAYCAPGVDDELLGRLGTLHEELRAVHADGELAACALLGRRSLLRGLEAGDFRQILTDVREVSRLAPALGHWVHQARAGAARFAMASVDPALGEQLLTQVATGAARTGVAISETEAGSSLRAMETTAKRTDGGWHLTGTKRWIFRSDLVTHLIVLARDRDEDVDRSFLLDVSAPGIHLAEDGRFLAGEPYGVLRLDAHVDDGARIDLPFDDFFGTYALERMGGAAKLVGYCEGALDLIVHRLRDRSQGGQRLAERQAMRLALAEAVERTAAASSLVDAAANLFAAAAAGTSVLDAATIAKVVASEAAVHTANVAVQVHGAAGCDDSHFAGVLWRMARGYEIAGGTTEILRDRFARRLLTPASRSISPSPG